MGVGTYLGDVPVGVLQADRQLHLVPDLDAVLRDVLHALPHPLGQVQLLLDNPPLLPRILYRIVPVHFRRVELPPPRLPLRPVLLIPRARPANIALPNLQQPRLDIPELQPLEQRREPHLDRQRPAEHDGLLRDHDGVLDLVGPDVLDAHGVQELERRRLERPDDAHVLVGVDVGGEAAAGDARLEAVGDRGLGDALERLARVAGEHVLEGELVVAGLEDDGLGFAADEGLPAVLEDRDRLVDFVLGDARGCDLCLGEPGAC